MLQPIFFLRPCCAGGKNLCARGSLFGEWRILFAKLWCGMLIWCLNLNEVWLNVYYISPIWIAAEIADWSDTASWYNLQQRKCSRKFCFRATLWTHKTSTSIPTILPVAQTWGSYGDAAAILVWRPDSSREWIGGEGYCSKALTNRVGLSSWSSNNNLILFSCDRSTSPDFFRWFLGSGIHWMFSLSYESLDLGYLVMSVAQLAVLFLKAWWATRSMVIDDRLGRCISNANVFRRMRLRGIQSCGHQKPNTEPKGKIREFLQVSMQCLVLK